MDSKNINASQNVITSFRVYLSTFLRSSNSRLLLWIPTILFLLSFFFYPLTKILALTFDFSTLANRENLLITYHSLLFTFYQATLSTILTFILGIPSAILFSRFNFRGKSILRALTAVPFMLPTVVVAAAFNSLTGYTRLFFFLSLSSFLQLHHFPTFHFHLDPHSHTHSPRFLQHHHHHPHRWQRPLAP